MISGTGRSARLIWEAVGVDAFNALLPKLRAARRNINFSYLLNDPGHDPSAAFPLQDPYLPITIYFTF
jgi:hypothetical protein